MSNSRHNPVLTKADHTRRFIRGQFGNRGPTWDSLGSYLDSNYKGLVHIRNRKQAGGNTYYSLSKEQVVKLWPRLDDGGYFLAAMAPHHLNVLQGEVERSERGLELYYSRAVGLPMRDALAKSPKVSYGLRAKCLLQAVMDPASYDWLQELLDLYPGHVIEFSVFSKPWGTIPNRNTVVWECRLY